MKIVGIVAVVLVAGSVFAQNHPLIPETNERLKAQTKLDGHKNTPMQPAPYEKWHVHDPDRPQPKVAKPKYDGKPVKAPKKAIIIFDGKEINETVNKSWQVKDGYMTVGRGKQKSKQAFGDMHLHLEFRIPLKCVRGWGQKQGNSGVFIMDTYEIQVLNGWGNRTYPDGMVGALYGHLPPLVNAAKKPCEWQSYDIHFEAPTFKEGKVEKKAKITAYLNKVKVQDKSEYNGASTWRKIPKYKPHPAKLPFSLQAHGNPVQYRNIWVVEK